MRHQAFVAAIGLVAAATLVPLSVTQAAAADPTGIWKKADQGERPGKMQVFRCGSGKRYLCAKIVWLQSPNDSRGRPLRDVRNENPSLRGRSIMGLPIINGMAPVGANRWKGNIYNPEDGNTYSATLTLVSHNKIHLKGCKAWLLCGERIWHKTSLPTPEPEPQIEAAAEPEDDRATATAEAPADENDAFAKAEVLTPAIEHGTQAGYRFLNASTSSDDHAGFSGENVPSMFVMTNPVATGAEGTSAAAPAHAMPAPAAKPQPVMAQPKPQPKPQIKRQTIQANAAPAPKPRPQTASRLQAAPRPAQAVAAPAPDAQPTEGALDPMETGEDAEATETAEAAIEPRRLTLRERRQLRRQQRLQQQEGADLLPWLR